MKHPNARPALLMFLIALLSLACGCSSEPPPVSPVLHVNQALRQRLMALAGEEAGKIVEVDPRLTRQLNIADMQIDSEWIDDARKTLAAARATLSAPDAAKLNDQARIGGWVSVSELSRRIHDMAVAAVATGAALAELDKIEDPGKRCDYVMGIANELQYINGKSAAAALLARAGPWTRFIDNLASRRQAVVAFSTALFNLDDFAAGQAMLRQDPDATWRSDVLAGMARIDQTALPQAGAGFESGQTIQGSPATQPFYGRPLDYDDVFKNQKMSQTSK